MSSKLAKRLYSAIDQREKIRAERVAYEETEYGQRQKRKALVKEKTKDQIDETSEEQLIDIRVNQLLGFDRQSGPISSLSAFDLQRKSKRDKKVKVSVGNSRSTSSMIKSKIRKTANKRTLRTRTHFKKVKSIRDLAKKLKKEFPSANK